MEVDEIARVMLSDEHAVTKGLVRARQPVGAECQQPLEVRRAAYLPMPERL